MDSGCLCPGRAVSIQSLVGSNLPMFLSKLHTSEGRLFIECFTRVLSTKMGLFRQ